MNGNQEDQNTHCWVQLDYVASLRFSVKQTTAHPFTSWLSSQRPHRLVRGTDSLHHKLHLLLTKRCERKRTNSP